MSCWRSTAVDRERYRTALNDVVTDNSGYDSSRWSVIVDPVRRDLVEEAFQNIEAPDVREAVRPASGVVYLLLQRRHLPRRVSTRPSTASGPWR